MIFEAFKPVLQQRSATVVSNGGGLFGMFGATASGKPVTTNSALTLSAFYNALEIISNDYAKMPKAVFQNIDGNRTKQRNHPVHNLISKRPNALMSAFMLDKMLIQSAILKGNGYAEVVRNQYSAKPEQVFYINQDKTPVKVTLSEGKLWYHFNNKTVAAENMLHYPGFSFNGITGIGIVQFAANSLGIGLSSAEFASDYYKNKGQGTIVLASNSAMDATAKTRYAEAFRSRIDQPGNTKVVVADEIKGVQNLKLTPQEALLLETNNAVVLEVARFLNIPPHKLKQIDNSNFSNMESQNIQHVADSILPWSIKFQQEQEYKLFSKTEIEAGYYIKHNTAILLQADKKTQAEYYRTMVNIMAYTPQEIREFEELNKIDGLNEPFVPVNMQPLSVAQINYKDKKQGNTQNS